MVRFNENDFTIKFNSSCPIEDWLELQKELSLVLSVCEFGCNENYLLMTLFKEMMPDYETALKMNPESR